MAGNDAESGVDVNAIQKYFRYRQSLIDQYRKGDMSKKEYLQKNYEAVTNNGILPFRHVDTIDKGLYNYQYYNALAKQMKCISEGLQYATRKDYESKSNAYYHKKDQATFTILRLLNYQGVTAYFIKVRSKYLKGKLFEIALPEEYGILHSTSLFLRERLQEEEVFLQEVKLSLIDDYVNQKY